MSQGKAIIFSAPSGAGKTTIVRHLMGIDDLRLSFSISAIERIWKNGGHVIFDLDVIGGLNLKKILGDKALSIFVKAPSVAVLEERLRKRSTESPEKIEQRVSKAQQEMAFEPRFDRVIVNEQLDQALLEAEACVRQFLALS